MLADALGIHLNCVHTAQPINTAQVSLSTSQDSVSLKIAPPLAPLILKHRRNQDLLVPTALLL